ncbi:MAG: response regulator transcription factor [Candidatus Obscuribacterales bacterium]
MTTVLIVEDLPALREHAAKVVKETLGANVQIVEANNGATGIEMAKKHDPDMVLLDINMPDMSGVKVAEAIWKEKPNKKILFWSQFHKESYVRAISKILPDEAIHGYALKGEVSQNLAYAIDSVFTHDNSYIDPVNHAEYRLSCEPGSFNDVRPKRLTIDIAVGLTDRAIAKRRHISVRSVQKRISALLGFAA